MIGNKEVIKTMTEGKRASGGTGKASKEENEIFSKWNKKIDEEYKTSCT